MFRRIRELGSIFPGFVNAFKAPQIADSELVPYLRRTERDTKEITKLKDTIRQLISQHRYYEGAWLRHNKALRDLNAAVLRKNKKIKRLQEGSNE